MVYQPFCIRCMIAKIMSRIYAFVALIQRMSSNCTKPTRVPPLLKIREKHSLMIYSGAAKLSMLRQYSVRVNTLGSESAYMRIHTYDIISI